MAKYDVVLEELKNPLSAAKSILICLPPQPSIDKLASALALFLSLKQVGKQVAVVSESPSTVSVSNLYGINALSQSLPKAGGGNYTISLEGVVASDGSVPALEKLDWFPSGNNLNLVFHVLPGQTFNPTNVVSSTSGGGVDLIFAVGTADLKMLGGIYLNNPEVFTGTLVVNIDNDQINTQFGKVNIVDPASPTICEMILQLLQGLTLPIDADIASNLLDGIYDSTANLTAKVTPETFLTVASAMQLGGKLSASKTSDIPAHSAPIPEANTPAANYAQNFPPLNQVFGFPLTPEPVNAQSDNFTVPPVVNSDLVGVNSNENVQQGSAEERPMGEVVSSSNPEVQNPEPDWLTPKVFKGGNLG